MRRDKLGDLMRNIALRNLLAIGLLALGTQSAWGRFEPVTCKNAFTVEQEISEGNKVAAQVYQQMPVLPENSPITRYVQQLGARLVTSAPPSPGTNERWPYNFHVVASSDINAFALPGGSIFVNLGTIQAADTEAQLAGVMAHEISHVVMRHSTCNLSKQQKRGLLYGLGAIGSAVLLGDSAAGQLAQRGIGIGQSLDFLHMSRDDEKQADLLGVNILNDAGYDPRGLPQFFETIQAKVGPGGAQFLSDHPNPGNRTEYVNAEISTLPQRPNPTVTTAEFKQIHTQALAQKALSPKDVQEGRWRGSGNYANGPGSNGAIIPASGGAGANSASTASAAPLSISDLGLDGPTTTFQSQAFTLRYPAKWRQQVDSNGTVLLSPPGGSGQFGIAYGALISTVRPKQPISDRASLLQVTAALAQRLISQNEGMGQLSDVTPIDVGDTPAAAVDLQGHSPLQQGGAPLYERDRIVTFARTDGNLTYMVCVAPERDFTAMKPTFDAMVRSFRQP
jgi:hypothetical protein